MPVEQCTQAKAKLERAKQRRHGLLKELTEDEAKLAHLRAQAHPDASAVAAQERVVALDRRFLETAEDDVGSLEDLVHALCDDLP
ncbi:hypothetical protein [Streptomyces hilarionis]|uniref:hypothetical protein n=1 Tax=Streptomyces hilarionis TaxID=2839954 RepID=UPI00211A8441|nr:hypothetical protein [Streptomyces hilarionis]MCQ9136218.1 hypothetical protein [Streptomyces hilarionis]